MTQINVISSTQKIIVDAASSSVAIINAGPAGPTGGGAGSATASTVDIVDLANHYTGTNVELALAEAAVRLNSLEDDPELTTSSTAPSSPSVGDIWADIS